MGALQIKNDKSKKQATLSSKLKPFPFFTVNQPEVWENTEYELK